MFRLLILILAISLTCCLSGDVQNETSTTHVVTPSPKYMVRDLKSLVPVHVDKGYFSLMLPRSCREKPMNGEDSELWKFSDDNFTIDIESGIYAPKLDDLKKYPEYEEAVRKINGKVVKIVSFNVGKDAQLLEEPLKKFIVAAYFARSASVRNDLTIKVGYKSENDKQIALDILDSVKFR